MTHFAKLDENNRVVSVVVGREEDDGKEQELSDRTGDQYVQTSYNTRCGIHYDPTTGEPSADQSKALRKNFAGIGYTYDQNRDAFIPPRPHKDWILNEFSCDWEPPVPCPTDGAYDWNETEQQWVKLD